MDKITREVLNQKEYLVVRLEEGEYLDEDCLATVSSGQDGDRKAGIEGILPISYTQFEGRLLRYDINAYVPFAEYKKQIRGAEALCRVFLSVLDTYTQAESYLLDPACFLLKQEYIYVDKGTGKAWLVIYPVYDIEGRAAGSNGDFPGLFRNMLRGIRLSEEDMAFYGSLSYELDSEESFNIVAFRRFLAEKGKRGPAMQEEKKPAVPLPPDAGKPARVPVAAGGKKEADFVPKPREAKGEMDAMPSQPPFGGDAPDTPQKRGGGGLFAGLFGGKSGKAKKTEDPEKNKPVEKQDNKRAGGIRLPDEEELPEGFPGGSKNKPKDTESLGGKKKKEDKKKEKKKEEEKKDEKRATHAFEAVAQTDDEPGDIPPTDDDDFDERTIVRRLYLEQPDTGETIPVGRFPFVIGRECSGLIVDASKTKVSREHVVIEETAEGFTVRDISRHGTFLDGVRIQKNEDVPLKDGMKVLLKEILFIVHIEERIG